MILFSGKSSISNDVRFLVHKKGGYLTGSACEKALRRKYTNVEEENINMIIFIEDFKGMFDW